MTVKLQTCDPGLEEERLVCILKASQKKRRGMMKRENNNTGLFFGL